MSQTLYHGSKSGLVGPIAPTSRSCCDFGRGFYMGDSALQPQTLICRMDHPVLYKLSVDMDGLEIRSFQSVREWALFVAYNRGAMSDYADTPLFARMAEIAGCCDFLQGRIANDRVFYAAQRFFDGVITIETLAELLQALNYGNQFVALNEKACSRIRIVDHRELTPDECENLRRKASAQRARSEALTDEIIRSRRHRDGFYFDEICERIAAGGEIL